jgi:uncharacterized OsmC-like protein
MMHLDDQAAGGTMISSTLTYQVTAQVTAGGAAHAMAHSSRIPFDGSAQTGTELPGPADLLCAALAACLLKNVERFSHTLKFHYASASVEVTATRQDVPPHISAMTYALTVLTDELPHRVDLLHRNVLKYGTISNTLSASCPVTGSLVAAPLPSSPGVP